ncbi:ribosome biogenesis GTPase RsgA [Kosmotoga arenicorallina S304]|uniref:Small ribosomal subunit biogenesis GTPase RsgA n=1 Tax=Kosmotoga arenicorallina S304 TaxID=1453497 RepID=A0A176K1F1_9BACT|nr:ribosome small subunit-dependent GTPase A [Kosmotoga arenicorallina]OAA30905.1 ribosome biogenesis GTPase RsgA [Kosmotoga arenicorallina S304]
MSHERLKGNVIRYDSRTLIVTELHSRKHYLCDMPGRFKKLGIKPLVGDVVEFIPTGDDTGRVENILNRRNELKRPRIANVDQIVLVTCLEEPGVPFYILDRFLVLAEYSGLPTIIAVNKVDLLKSRRALLDLYHTYGEYYNIIEVSAKTGYNIDLLREVFKGKISTMAGMSGVGKSSLLNALNPGLKLKTSDISKKLDRGRHTTTRVELLEFDFGGYVADTPGFASLELPEIEPEELKNYFRDLRVHSGYCSFSDCVHVDEPGCYVKELVETGDIPTTRYESYRKIYEELQEKHKEKKRWK